MPRVDCGFVTSEQQSGADLLCMHGPTLWVDVGFDASHDRSSDSLPAPSRRNVPALVDTGALQSCIDAGLAQELQLPLVDRVQVSGVGGTHSLNAYLAQISVPSLKRTIFGTFAGVQLEAGGQVHRVLIGRTFLQHCMLVYDGSAGNVVIMS